MHDEKEARAVLPPAEFQRHFGHHWLAFNGTDEMCVMQWNPGSRTWTQSNAHDTGRPAEMAGWRWVQHVPLPTAFANQQRERDGEVERLREALSATRDQLRETMGTLMLYDGHVTNPTSSEGWSDSDGHESYMAAKRQVAKADTVLNITDPASRIGGE